MLERELAGLHNEMMPAHPDSHPEPFLANDTVQVGVISTASGDLHSQWAGAESQQTPEQDEGSTLLQGFEERSVQHTRSSSRTSMAPRMSLKAIYAAVRGSPQPPTEQHLFGAFEHLPSSTSAVPSTPTTTNADPSSDDAPVEETPTPAAVETTPAVAHQQEQCDNTPAPAAPAQHGTVPMLQGTYVGFPMLWVPTQSPTPRALHKATRFTVAAALQPANDDGKHVLARRVRAQLHRLLAEALLLSNLPEGSPGRGPGPVKSLQTLLEEAGAALMALCKQHVGQHGGWPHVAVHHVSPLDTAHVAAAVQAETQALAAQVEAAHQQLAEQQEATKQAKQEAAEAHASLQALQDTVKVCLVGRYENKGCAQTIVTTGNQGKAPAAAATARRRSR